MWKRKCRDAHPNRQDRRRPARRVRLVELAGIELLDRRILPAVTATFSAGGALLRVIGDAEDNTIVVSRDASGTILVNDGAVLIQGGPATVANTSEIFLLGQGGNDNLSLDETNGAMPGAAIFGGDGNDVLTGGSGDDFVDGGTGNDSIFLGPGDDTFTWNPGDGSDAVDGQGGSDEMVFNGANVAENIAISANGNRVRFTRDVGGVTIDLGGVETIDFNAMGGADVITVNDQSATGLQQVNLDLSVPGGGGDGQIDSVILNGTDGADTGQITASGDGTLIQAFVSALPLVNIIGATATSDSLTVNALGGDDVVDASLLPANRIGLVLNGGAGNDLLLGSPGSDVVIGGPGADTAELGDGGDTFVWNPGDGSDTVDGQGGSDRMVFNGSDASEAMAISANGNRVRFTRDIGNVTMDLGGIETIDVNALGGADSITVNDQSATDLTAVNVNLNNFAGSGDGEDDIVTVNGTEGDDAIQILSPPSGTKVAVMGLFPAVNITGAEGASDTLTVNALGGNDVLDASNLAANLIGLILNGGAGNDQLLGSPGADLVIGGPGADTVGLGDGGDAFVWNPGDGSDTVEGQGGSDRMVFNGSDVAEAIAISANGNRVRLTRDVGNVTMDLNGVETIAVNALGGADTITVNDQSATSLAELDLNLNSAAGVGDGQADSVVVNGTEGDDAIQILSPPSGTKVAVMGLFPAVNITGAEGASDTLTVNALGGNDVLDASNLAANLIGLTLNGGAGNNIILTNTATLSISSSQPASTYGQAVSFTATVNPPTGGPVPTGMVQFVVDGANFGAAVALVDGTATSAALSNLGAGVHTILASYSGDGNYAATTHALTQAVNKAHLTVTADPKSKRYGETVPALTATISGFANGDGPDVVSGAPSLTTDATSASGAGTYAILVGVGTLSAANYDFANVVNGTLIVTKATPTLAWDTPADITFGTPLGAAQLNATVSATGPDPATGALTYSLVPGTVLHVGAGQTLTVTVAATANYEAVSKSVTINVRKATPIVTWDTPADITFGTPLGPAQLNAIVSATGPDLTTGVLTYSLVPGTVLHAGMGQTLTVTVAATANYESVSKSVTINILKATPTLTWTNPADINAGTLLGPAQLNAVSSVPGTLVYTPAEGTILNAGQGRVLSATFTPTDAADFNPVTITTTINVVNPASPAPPQATGIVAMTHTRKGLVSITATFDEALDSGSLNNPGLFSVLGGVKKRGKTVFSKSVHISGVNYDDTAHTVTITLARPHKGRVQVMIRPGVVAANGASSSAGFTAWVK